ncbi:MAG: hypothetical protein LWY06_19995 [Firmicutes bacterium]|nr:hypothetical protein [Bacillota bacterium]
MDIISIEVRQEIDGKIADGKIPEALEIISGFTDLKNNDLPVLSKTTVRSLENNIPALREMTFGLVSVSSSVRKFCRKYLMKAGSAIAGELLYLAVESADPLRPVPESGEGLLGSFGGYASPVGKIIRENNFSIVIKAPSVYSPAQKYGREALEALMDVLAAVKPEYLIYLEEYTEALVRSPIDPEPQIIRAWEVSEKDKINLQDYEIGFPIFIGTLQEKAQQGLIKSASKGNSFIWNAANNWTKGKLLMDESPADSALKPVFKLFADLRECDKTVSRRRVRYFSGRLQRCFPREKRVELFYNIWNELKTGPHDDKIVVFIEKYLSEYVESYPEEIDGKGFLQYIEDRKRQRLTDYYLNKAEEEPAAVREVLKFTGKSKDKPIEEQINDLVEGYLSLSKTASEDGSNGILCGDVLDIIGGLAYYLKLPVVWEKTEKLSGNWDEDSPEDAPGQSLSPYAQSDEKILLQICILTEKYMNNGEKNPVIPESELQENQWYEQLAELLNRFSEPFVAEVKRTLDEEGEIPSFADNYSQAQKFYFDVLVNLEKVILTASALLPEKFMEKWACQWVKEAFCDKWNMMSNSFEILSRIAGSRKIFSPSLYISVLSNPGKGVAGQNQWQMVVAKLYQLETETAAEAVRKILATISQPDSSDYYKRKDWNKPYQWIISKGWDRKDSVLLGTAFSFCAVPFYLKSDKALIPYCTILQDDKYAPNTSPAENNMTISEIWELICEKSPELIDNILRNAFMNMEIEEFPRYLVQAAVKSKYREFLMKYSDEIINLLNSSQAAIVTSALSVITCFPELLKDKFTSVMPVLKRVSGSASSGTMKALHQLIPNLIPVFPDYSDELINLLADSVFIDSTPLVESALKNLKKSLEISSGLKNPVFEPDKKLISRLEELKGINTPKFSKHISGMEKFMK